MIVVNFTKGTLHKAVNVDSPWKIDDIITQNEQEGWNSPEHQTRQPQSAPGGHVTWG